MTLHVRSGVACLWLVWLSGCALQVDAESSNGAEPVTARTEPLRRRSPPPPPPTPLPAATPQPAAQAAAGATSAADPTRRSVCGPGSYLAPGMTPPGYRLSTIAAGTSTLITLVPDDTAVSVPLPTGYRVECSTTAYGERFVQLIPPSSPSVEVLPGGVCGVVNQAGLFLQCVIGSTCLSRGDGQPGICQPYPSAPVNQG